MEFLRRLAPRREGDATRAVAALPSRFASESPLRATTIGQTRPAGRPDEDDTSLSLDATSAAAATDVLAAPRHPATGVQPSRAAPWPLGSGSTRPDDGKATSSSHAPAEAPNIHAAESRVFQDRHDAHSQSVTPGGPEVQALAAALAASHGLQSVAAPPSQSRAALPLSDSILAQRTLQSRDDSQVVHVTIGRIDVVANTAPAPVARRKSTPRQGTVPLADYLRVREPRGTR